MAIESLTFNGLDLSTSIYGDVFIDEADLDSPPPLRSSSSTAPFLDGNIAERGHWLHRDVPVSCNASAATKALLDTALDQFKLAIGAREDEILRFAGKDGRYLLARIVAQTRIRRSSNEKAAIDMVFRCHDPFWYDNDETTENYTIETNPDNFSLTYSGTVEAKPQWIVTNSTGGNVTMVIVENEEQSQTASWTGTLADGYKLRFNVERQVVEKSPVGQDDWENVMSGFQGQWPVLGPGTNSIEINGLDTGSLDVIYRARYL